MKIEAHLHKSRLTVGEEFAQFREVRRGIEKARSEEERRLLLRKVLRRVRTKHFGDWRRPR